MRYIVDKTSINDIFKRLSKGDELFLKNGIYNEKIQILTDDVKIYGESKENTIIVNHDFFHKVMPDFKECNTFRTYTVYVGANNVTLSNLTIKNSSTPSTKYGQAVALHVDGNNFKAVNVILDSAQDTLFTGPLPPDLIIRHEHFLEPQFLKSNESKQVYENCIIKGDTDFIFGTAVALFYNCDIISIAKEKLKGDVDGFISAPAHNLDQKYGYLFYKCNLIAEDNVENVYLARPWRDYGLVAFIDCKIGNHINKLGFNKWEKTDRDKTARFIEYSEGIDLSKRVKWSKQLTKDEAQKYVDEYMEYIKNN